GRRRRRGASRRRRRAGLRCPRRTVAPWDRRRLAGRRGREWHPRRAPPDWKRQWPGRRGRGPPAGRLAGLSPANPLLPGLGVQPLQVGGGVLVLGIDLEHLLKEPAGLVLLV